MHDLKRVSDSFLIPGDFRRAEPYGSGHINDTYKVDFNQAGTPVRYIFQRINPQVFPDPGRLMENVRRVCEHAQEKLRAAGAEDASRRALSLIPTRDGGFWHVDGADFWRCYPFIEKARTYDLLESTAHAEAGAKAFGRFQGLLSDLEGERLFETIPNFHHTRRRYERLIEVFESDPCGRAAGVDAEMDFVQQRESDVGRIIDALEAGALPERITHNDTKLNNVMIDDDTGEGVCVIDLDTVMPGTALNDFGDMVRTATNSAAEDERDLSRIHVRLDYFEALIRGYLDGAGDFLTEREVELLPVSGKIMTLECGMRFLTDYLEGDVYFKTKRDGHNLDRCRTQFRLVRSLEENMSEMQRLVDQLSPHTLQS
jgi:hypothetical protein